MLLLNAFIMAANDSIPVVVHPVVGTTAKAKDLSVTLVAKIQNLAVNPVRDSDIKSPKSVNIAPGDSVFFINSLEGCRTPVYRLSDLQKLYTIRHHFTAADSALWFDDGMTFTFSDEHESPHVFGGKPVEGTFSHSGRYFWVPYYRRTYDTNAQEPSAMAVIDTKRQCIVRVFNTNVLPKMVATSHDGKTIAVTHWGDNTVCTIDCHDANPARWRYTNEYVVDYRFVVHAPKDSVINRDMGSGNALRGTLFTPDDRYLLVGCMGGSGGIAVIDLQQHKYLGRLTGMMQNLRHMIISGDYIYLSINSKGYVQRLPLTNLYAAIDNFANGKKIVPVHGWQSAKVGAGARTICASPDGRFIFAACNFSNCVSVVDARTMKEVIRIAADSYPVGMDITSDGKTLIVTSQGRRDKGGNSVDIFSIK